MKKFEEKVQKLINLYKVKKFSEAEKITNRLIKEEPKNAWYYNFIGLIKIEKGNFNTAIDCFKKGIKIDPKNPIFYDNLGTVYKLKKDYLKSESYYKKSIELNDNNPQAHNNLGNLYKILNNNNKAIESYKNSIKVKTNFYPAHYNLGIAYKSIGDFIQAKFHLEKSIEVNNNFFTAHRSLSEIISYSNENLHFQQLKRIYEDKKNINMDKRELAFALGKAYEDVKNYKMSFKLYSEGNKFHRSSIKFSIKNEIKLFNKIKKAFNKKLFEKNYNTGIEDKTPIFILGMPRSGTTLVEQILSSHPDVFAGDELNYFPESINSILGSKKDDNFFKKIKISKKNELEKIGKAYLNKLRLLSKSKMVTDKLPINFKWIGLIKIILPNAKIIHCVRNSKDTCLSIYKNFFVNKELNYAYDQIELAKFYNLYFNLMTYWKKIFPDFIYDIKYENIVSDPKKEIGKLLHNCNLNWYDSCLNFHKNTRVIKTASDTQVRKKIYKSSLNQWKNYELYCYKLFNNLKN